MTDRSIKEGVRILKGHEKRLQRLESEDQSEVTPNLLKLLTDTSITQDTVDTFQFDHHVEEVSRSKATVETNTEPRSGFMWNQSTWNFTNWRGYREHEFQTDREVHDLSRTSDSASAFQFDAAVSDRTTSTSAADAFHFDHGVVEVSRTRDSVEVVVEDRMGFVWNTSNWNFTNWDGYTEADFS